MFQLRPRAQFRSVKNKQTNFSLFHIFLISSLIMSFFGGSTPMRQQQAIDPQNIMMAEQELEMVTDLFNR